MIDAKLITVASYNIHRCIGRDRRHDPDRVAAVIAELGADIIGLQEVSARPGIEHGIDQLDFLAQASGLTAIPGPTLVSHTGQIGNGILTRYPVRALSLVDLSLPRREPRGAIHLEIDVDGQPIRFVNAHLGLRVGERRSQVERLLAALPLEDAGLTIVLGDFNEWRAVSSLRVMHRGFASGVLSTFPTQAPFLPLDRVFVRPRAALASLHVHRTPLARVASDHLPVCARILLASPDGAELDVEISFDEITDPG